MALSKRNKPSDSGSSSNTVLSELQCCMSMTRLFLYASFVAMCVTATNMFHELNMQNWLLTDERIMAQRHRPFVVLVQLSGEFGNHLSKIAYGRALQLILEQDYQIDSKLVLRNQGARYAYKWESATRDLQKCFPWTQQFNFSQGNVESVYNDFAVEYKQQSKPSHSNQPSFYQQINDNNNPRAALDTLRTAVKDYRKTQLESHEPFVLYADQFLHGNHIFMDRFYREFRTIFRMSTECCPLQGSPKLPHPKQESVIHIRNYLEEMPRRQGSRAGPYQEASPDTVAKILFPDLQSTNGDRVAIVGPTTPGRFRNQPDGAIKALDDHRSALEEQGIQTRIVTGGSDMDEFCFLLRTQRALVGLETSTFVYWAAILGQAEHVRLYSIVRNETDANEAKVWSNTDLMDRIEFLPIVQ